MHKPGEIFAEARVIVTTGIWKPKFMTASLVVLLGSFLETNLNHQAFLVCGVFVVVAISDLFPNSKSTKLCGG